MKRLLANLFLSLCVLTAPYMSATIAPAAQEVVQKKQEQKAETKKQQQEPMLQSVADVAAVCVILVGIIYVATVLGVREGALKRRAHENRSGDAKNQDHKQQDSSVKAHIS